MIDWSVVNRVFDQTVFEPDRQHETNTISNDGNRRLQRYNTLYQTTYHDQRKNDGWGSVSC